MRSPETVLGQWIPTRPLFAKELREVLSGRALWTMLLLLCPLVGYSFIQATSLYGEASSAAFQSPVLASSLSPLDGILVPTLGAFYVGVTLLFPFVAIRVLGQEKKSGALKLLVQLPYAPSTLVLVKLGAVMAAWLIASVPAMSALVVWLMLGGHLSPTETLTLLLGHALYGLLIGSIAIFAASITESSATAAIVTLAFTIGSWVLDFTVAGQPGLLGWLSRLSLTQTLRTFEQGLLSLGLLVGLGVTIAGFAALAAIWLPPGIARRAKLIRSGLCLVVIAGALGAAAQARTSFDVTEDQRNSFASAHQHAVAAIPERLTITVHMTAEDPRYADLQRNVLSKLDRTLSKITIRLEGGRAGPLDAAGGDHYGEVDYGYAGKADTSRSTSAREILPLIFGLAGRPLPDPGGSDNYPGYPLVVGGLFPLLWLFGGLPLLIIVAWWWSRRPPHGTPFTTLETGT